MSNLGLPVPPGFTITTEACRAYIDAGEMPESLMESVTENLGELEDASGKRLGDTEDPLLVSVRSGVAASMPGMMDTVLNLGQNDTAVEGLAQRTGDERFVRLSYWRFIQMFGDIVLGIDGEKFDEAFDELKEERGVEEDPDLGADDLDGLIDTYKRIDKRIVDEEAGRPFPEEPREHLELAIRAVFDFWNNDWALLPQGVRHPRRPQHRRDRHAEEDEIEEEQERRLSGG